MKVPWSTSEWRRVAVYGLGVSGRAAARLLRRRGVDVIGLDGRELDTAALGELADDPGVELRLGAELESLPPGVDGLVLSPGVPPGRPLVRAARAAGLPVVAEVELAFPLLDGPVVGISGSNGKSTTTVMTGDLVRDAGIPVEVCGNIGRPLSDCVEGEPGRVFVVELSSFQLEAVETFRPRAAALLNLSPDHLDRYPDLAAYRAAKARLFAAQGPGDTAVVNADDPLVAAAVADARRRLFSLSRPVEDGCFLAGDEVLEVGDGAAQPLFSVGDLAVSGSHNVENAMAASLLALAVGVPREAISRSLGCFRGLPHRLALVRERGGVRWFDDSKGTNPGATLRALSGFGAGSVHIILGGRDKGADFGELVEAIAATAHRAYLVGEAAEQLAERLADRVPVERSGDVATAVCAASQRASDGEVVLLSPACASFDQYESFEARGRHFEQLVMELPEVADG